MLPDLKHENHFLREKQSIKGTWLVLSSKPESWIVDLFAWITGSSFLPQTVTTPMMTESVIGLELTSDHYHLRWLSFFLNYLFILLCQVLVAARGILGRCCGMQYLIPWSGIEPRPPALGAQNLSLWTRREVPEVTFKSNFQREREDWSCVPSKNVLL